MLSLATEKFTHVHENALSLLFPARPLGLVQKFLLPLQRIGCTRQTESKLSLRSFALSLQRIGCTRQTESKLSLRSFALSLQRIDGTFRSVEFVARAKDACGFALSKQ